MTILIILRNFCSGNSFSRLSSGLRIVAITFQPSFANFLAAVLPNPVEHPVIKTVFCIILIPPVELFISFGYNQHKPKVNFRVNACVCYLNRKDMRWQFKREQKTPYRLLFVYVLLKNRKRSLTQSADCGERLYYCTSTVL